MHFLEVKNLTHNYTVAGKTSYPAINNISFSLDRGEILGIIGHTGSGKSTLVSHLNGLIKPDSGQILLDGADIWEKPKEISKIRSRIGLVFQYPEYQLFEDTVYADIAYGPKNMGLSDEEINERIKLASQLLGIKTDLFEKSPFDLSGGQKRRVAIAGIIAMEPEIIVFDEPTAGLDPIGRQAIFKAIREYREKKNASVIIVSHSMEDMAAICDNVLVLNKGHVYDYGSANEIFTKAESLNRIGLNAPMIADVFKILNQKYGYNFKNVITVDEAVDMLIPLIKKEVSSDD